MITLQNCYIFIKKYKSKKQDDEQGRHVLTFTKSSYNYIKKAFPTAKRSTELWSNTKKLTLSISTDTYSCDILFTIFETSESDYLNINVSGKTRIQIIKCLEDIETKLLSSGIEKEMIVIHSYDSISEHYCNKLYPKLNMTERNLKHLLFNTYIVNFGKNYLDEIEENVRHEAYKNLKAKGSKQNKEIVYLQNLFYSLDYHGLESLLFNERNTEKEKQAKKDFLLKNKDLSKLSDAELRGAFLDYTPKTDWDRYFSQRITDFDVSKAIKTLRDYRNVVAHCKLINKSSYMECKTILKEFNKAICNAIKLTESKDFRDKHKDALNDAVLTLIRISTKLDKIYTKIIDNASRILDSVSSGLKAIDLSSSAIQEYNSENSLKSKLIDSFTTPIELDSGITNPLSSAITTASALINPNDYTYNLVDFSNADESDIEPDEIEE